MAYESRNSKYSSEVPVNHHNHPHHHHHHHHHHSRSTEPNVYPYSLHRPHTDENRNENNCDNKEGHRRHLHTSSGTQTIQKVDAATMTEPLRIDFRLTSEYLARCSSNIGLPTCMPKYEEHNCHQVRTKMEYDIEPRHINGVLIYHCPECAYRFQDQESLHAHLEEHRQRPHICDICGVSLKRKEHLDRHKQGHNKDRPYQCSMCCKAFKRNEHLARHMIIHSGSKNHTCTECGKAFYRKDHLKKHLQSHNGSRKSIDDSQPQHGSANSQPDDMPRNLHAENSNFPPMMRQAGPPPFSILRT